MKVLSRLIRIVGDYLGAMLSRDLSVQLVIQLGNIMLEVDPNNPDGSIASESSQVKSSQVAALSHLLGVEGVESSCISQALTFKKSFSSP